MQVLWLKSDYIDPPDTGGKIRTYNLLRELCKHCEVTYISLRNDAGLSSSESELNWASRAITFASTDEKKSGLLFYLRVLAAMVSTRPYIVQKYQRADFLEVQRRVANGREVSGEMTLVCDFLEMAGNVDWSLPCRKILFEHNVESVIWHRYYQNERNILKRAYFFFEYLRMRRYERIACNRFDLVLAVSEADKNILKSILGVSTPVEVIDTGVDTKYFRPTTEVSPIPGRLLFLGSLDWMPNIDGIGWFLHKVYPLIKKLCPEVSLDIVGRKPAIAIQEHAQRDQSVRVHGDVPDVRPYMSSADVFVVPLRVGSGTRLKIFEAMAMRMPVVSTYIGAEGLPVEDGRDILLSGSPKEFACSVTELLQDHSKKRAIAERGFELVTEKYSWSMVSTKLYKTCLRTANQGTPQQVFAT